VRFFFTICSFPPYTIYAGKENYGLSRQRKGADMQKAKFNNTLVEALKIYWTSYIGWGRATRSEYWWAYLFYGVLASIAAGVLAALGLIGIDWIWILVTMVPGFCVGVRRLHDTNRSAWNYFWFLLPIVGWIILIVFLCQKGDAAANRFGQPRI